MDAELGPAESYYRAGCYGSGVTLRSCVNLL